MIVSYGDALIDLFALPRGSSLQSAERFEPHLGGSPCNVAVVAARYGARARFVGAIGRDPFGEKVRAMLEAEGVDTAALAVLAERTPVTFIELGLDGSRSFFSHRVGTADGAMGVESLSERSLDGARWLHLATSSMRTDSRRAVTMALLSRAREKGLQRSVDLNVRPHLWGDRASLREAVRSVCEGATLVKASEEDLSAIGDEPTLEALEAIAPGAHAVLTLAERGARMRVRGAVVEVRSPEVTVIDSTGAGDAFVGALLASVDSAGENAVQNATIEQWRSWLNVACEAGSRAVTAVGATAAVRGT